MLSGSQRVLLLVGLLHSTCVLFLSLRKDCAALRTLNPSVSQDLVTHDLVIAANLHEILKNGNGVFSGTGMPDMLDSAWLAMKTPAETSKNETLTKSQSVEPLHQDVDNLLVTVSFSLDERAPGDSRTKAAAALQTNVRAPYLYPARDGAETTSKNGHRCEKHMS